MRQRARATLAPGFRRREPFLSSSLDAQGVGAPDNPRCLEGSARAVAAAGLEWSSVPVELVPMTSAESCLAGARALLDRAPDVTAVFAFSDRLALAARDAARERGVSVPGDLSIVGFDDTAPAGDGLTSVHQPLREKGRIAAERLLGALSHDPPPPGAELLPTRLVVRDSTAPPQRAGSAAT